MTPDPSQSIFADVPMAHDQLGLKIFPGEEIIVRLKIAAVFPADNVVACELPPAPGDETPQRVFIRGDQAELNAFMPGGEAGERALELVNSARANPEHRGVRYGAYAMRGIPGESASSIVRRLIHEQRQILLAVECHERMYAAYGSNPGEGNQSPT